MPGVPGARAAAETERTLASGAMAARAVYVSYDGLLEPLGQSQILPYVEALHRAGVGFALVTFEKPSDLAEAPEVAILRRRLEAQGLNWIPLRYHKRPPVLSTAVDVVRGAWHVWRLARRERAVILHARSYVAGLMAWPARALPGRRLIFDMRGFWVDERLEAGLWRRGLVGAVARRVERALFRRADAVVSLTDAAVGHIERHRRGARPVPVAVVPTCVDLARFEPKPRDEALASRLGLTGRRVLLYAGAAGTWGATDALLDFFSVAGGVLGDTALLLVIRGDADSMRRAVAHRGLTGRVAMATDVRARDLPRWLALADVGLALYRPGLSNVARFPTKLGEYLAAGLPVVLSAGVGDCDRLVSRARVGVLVREFTEAEYRRAAAELAGLLSEPDLGARCRALAARELSVQNGASRYLALYRALGGRGGPAGSA